MTRAPLQVLVLPFRCAHGRLEFAVFRRADGDGACWQGVSGGAEVGETEVDAARREFAEETGLSAERRWITLQARASIPAGVFACRSDWGENTYVIDEASFGVELADEDRVALSQEHSEVRWLPFAEARSLLRYDSNRTALWELNERLTRAST